MECKSPTFCDGTESDCGSCNFNKVETVRGMVLVDVERIEGIVILILRCNDYDEYKGLPQVVKYEGAKYGKTGWNSDRNIVCYRSDARIVEF